MKQLSPETEDVLRRARVAEPMPAGHRKRLKGAVLARIAMMSTTFVVGHAAAASMGLAAKGIAGLAVVATLGAGSYLALRPAADPTPKRSARPVRVAEPLPPTAVEPSPAPFPDKVVNGESAPPMPSRVKRPVNRSSLSREARALAQETALLRQADRALRAGDISGAMSFLDQHASRFPNGVLAPERSAERLIVRCQSGEVDAAAVAQYLEAHPASPLAARVRKACAQNR